MRVIIAGSRSIKNYGFVEDAINRSGFEITTLISGTARGVDKLGERWARKNNIPVERHPANWQKYGRSAGSIRNREMAKVADALILVWNGMSPGSRNMMWICKFLKIPSKLYLVDGGELVEFS